MPDGATMPERPAAVPPDTRNDAQFVIDELRAQRDTARQERDDFAVENRLLKRQNAALAAEAAAWRAEVMRLKAAQPQIIEPKPAA